MNSDFSTYSKKSELLQGSEASNLRSEIFCVAKTKAVELASDKLEKSLKNKLWYYYDPEINLSLLTYSKKAESLEDSQCFDLATLVREIVSESIWLSTLLTDRLD